MIRREIEKYLPLQCREVNGLKQTMTKTRTMQGSEVLLH